jgi:hypothetical protein
LVRELAGRHYLDRRENVLLAGNSGTGKTHLATALAFTACQQGWRVRFFTATGLVIQLLECREGRQLERLLVVDELGYVPCSKAGAELLFEVVSRAYERTSLIVTTNLPFEAWTEVLGSERLTGALPDRLTHRIRPKGQRGELPPARVQAPAPAAAWSGGHQGSLIGGIDTRPVAGSTYGRRRAFRAAPAALFNRRSQARSSRWGDDLI